MSIRKNTWDLDSHYDLTKSGENTYAESGSLYYIGGFWYFSAQNDEMYRSSPIQIPGNWSGVWAGYNETAGTKTDGTLWVWGAAASGSLGQNSHVPYSSPQQIPGTQWKSNGPNASAGVVGGGQECMYAIKTDNTLWIWGEGNYGKLGLNDLVNRSSPHQIPGTYWKEGTDNGFHHISFLKTDGTLFSQGNNTYGQLGLNDQVLRSSPTQVPGTQWSTISSGYYSTIASKTNGTLWAWGNGSYGTLGQNANLHRSSPVQIPGTWEHTRGKFAHWGSAGGVAIKTDGTLWTWGDNSAGVLGQNNNVQYSSPVQVPGTQWNHVDGGPIFSDLIAATKTDGTLWAWGYGNNGQLAQLDQVPRSSPVQVPGTSWNTINVGGGILAIT